MKYRQNNVRNIFESITWFSQFLYLLLLFGH